MLQDRFGLSERRACRYVGQHRSTQRREACVAADDGALRGRLREISRERPRWGYRRAHATLRGEGWEVNRKRVQCLWREEGLRVPVRRRKRRRLGDSTVPAARLAAERPDHVWAIDFQFDQTADGRILKLLHVVDEFTREALVVECRRRIDADRTVRVLDRILATRGRCPEFIRCDNGPEFHRQRAAGLVPLLPCGQRVYRARLAVAERLRRVLRLKDPRRTARRRDLLLPRRGASHGRGLAPGLQRAPATLSPRHASTRQARQGMQGPTRRARRLAAFAPRAHSARQRHP